MTIKQNAHTSVYRAVKNGVLPHLSSCVCEQCGAEAKAYHHNSYAEEDWLNVIPLCDSCHLKLHPRGKASEYKREPLPKVDVTIKLSNSMIRKLDIYAEVWEVSRDAAIELIINDWEYTTSRDMVRNRALSERQPAELHERAEKANAAHRVARYEEEGGKR